MRTIRELRNREELAANFTTCIIDILGVQEHRTIHAEPVRHERVLGNTLVTTSIRPKKIEGLSHDPRARSIFAARFQLPKCLISILFSFFFFFFFNKIYENIPKCLPFFWNVHPRSKTHF